MDHTPTSVPVASGAGFIRCSCGWKSQVQDDGCMFDPDPYNAEAAFRGHLIEVDRAERTFESNMIDLIH